MANDDAEGRDRRGVYLPTEMWDWLDEIAARDGTTRSDFLEGIVLLYQDDEQRRKTKADHRVRR